MFIFSLVSIKYLNDTVEGELEILTYLVVNKYCYSVEFYFNNFFRVMNVMFSMNIQYLQPVRTVRKNIVSLGISNQLQILSVSVPTAF